MAHTGNPFAIDADGDATLRLQVPAQFVKVLADRLDQLFGVTFVVTISGLEPRKTTT